MAENPDDRQGIKDPLRRFIKPFSKLNVFFYRLSAGAPDGQVSKVAPSC